MLNKSDLGNFTGTEHYYQTMMRKFAVTDGVQHIRENGGAQGAYWLVDAIISHQPDLMRNKDTRLQDMQFWKLKVDTVHHTAVLTCVADSGEPEVVKQKIEYTDFDLDEIDIWVEAGGPGMVLLLPSEH